MLKAVEVLHARALGLPVVHFKEVHRKEMVDFGELDGAEPVHCLETWPGTDYHPDTYPVDGEYPMQKRRYSCFVATDLDLLLRGLRVDTLVLVGAMTNVCVHYTFVDAHQLDYHVHVVEDAVYGSDGTPTTPRCGHGVPPARRPDHAAAPGVGGSVAAWAAPASAVKRPTARVGAWRSSTT